MRWPLFRRRDRHQHHQEHEQHQEPEQPQRQQSHSRTRVARAAEAASNVRAEMFSSLGSLGSARAGVGIMLTGRSAGATLTPAFALGGMPSLSGTPVPAARGLLEPVTAMPALLTQAAQVAQESGRSLEEVWAEALGAWLDDQETARVPRRRPAGQVANRRQRVWQDIDETLHGLRVG